jgi:hypothetical protein
MIPVAGRGFGKPELNRTISADATIHQSSRVMKYCIRTYLKHTSIYDLILETLLGSGRLMR